MGSIIQLYYTSYSYLSIEPDSRVENWAEYYYVINDQKTLLGAANMQEFAEKVRVALMQEDIGKQRIEKHPLGGMYGYNVEFVIVLIPGYRASLYMTSCDYGKLLLWRKDGTPSEFIAAMYLSPERIAEWYNQLGSQLDLQGHWGGHGTMK